MISDSHIAAHHNNCRGGFKLHPQIHQQLSLSLGCFHCLQDELERLRAENARLQRDNERFVRLVSAAAAVVSKPGPATNRAAPSWWSAWPHFGWQLSTRGCQFSFFLWVTRGGRTSTGLIKLNLTRDVRLWWLALVRITVWHSAHNTIPRACDWVPR
jgi:hypothetical protein